MNTVTYTMALLMGFTGSLHCAGMCGPIIWMMPFHAYSGFKKAVAIGLYHLGRISVYALFALVLHSFRSFFDPKVQQYLSIGLGLSLLVAGLVTFLPNRVFNINLPWGAFVKNHLGRLMGRPGLGAIAATGVMNGLLPCGLVYMALSASFAIPNAFQAVIFMYLFGAGTLPMLIGITVLRSKVSFARIAPVRRLAPVIIFAFGFLFLLRGMNLGIPYLSPKVMVTQHEIRSCCHKK